MNTKKKNARGITLIALVITIIVLLILAGVTINALSGENGIITKSKEAKIKTEKSKTIEKINLAILTAMTKGDGDIDNATLREELEKEGLTVKTEGNNLPWDVSDGKYIYRINEDYTVEEVEGINLSKKEIKLASGENETITATLTEGTTGKITWESSAPDIVKVENGKITAVGERGTATITAKVEGTEYQATCTVKIIQKITTITAGNIEMNIGDTQKINVTTTPTEGLIEDLEYTSGSPTIATVGADGNVKGIAEGTAVITIRGKNSGVSTTCTVTVKSNKINGAIEVGEYEKYYGKKVTNYTAGGKTYRIFYIDTEGKFGDKNTVYLKADWTANDTSLTASYTPSGTDLETYKKLNPSWASQRGDSTSNLTDSEYIAACLCSPSMWTGYCDTSKANYAIGSTPIEMYVESYNQVSHTVGNYKLGATCSTTKYPGYIYTLNGKQSTISNNDYYTGDNTLDYTGYNSMYCGKNGSTGGYYWWLASPLAGDVYYIMCAVDGYGASLGQLSYDNDNGICPLVSLKSSFQLEIEQ